MRGGTDRHRDKRNIDVKEKHQSVASCMNLDQRSPSNLDMCPDWDLNPQPFGVWDDTPTN